MSYVWRLEVTFKGSVLASHYVSSGYGGQTVGLGSKCLYQLSHLTSPGVFCDSYVELNIWFPYEFSH